MGSVADKIAKKLASSSGSKVVDLASWREGRKMAHEAGFGDDGLALDKLAGHDPCHALYALGQNVASLMAESISGMREAKGYVRIVGNAEDEYMPSRPPMSPLTVSYFTMWALFDVRFGRSRETMGSCILRIAPEFDCPSWLMVDAVERMQHSRMGFYVQCGSEGEGVLLREVGMLPAVVEKSGRDIPQTWIPPLMRRPVQMMISVRAGRISLTAFSDAMARFALRRPLVGVSSPGQRRISPSAMAWNLSTT